MAEFFKDKEHQKSYEEKGFIKTHLLGHEEIKALWAVHRSLPAPVTGSGFHTSIYSQPVETRHKASTAINEIIWKNVNSLFNDSRPAFSSFLTKEKGESGFVQMHQDWTFVDESIGNRSFQLWCPMVPTDDANGNLYVLRKSHLLPRVPRVAPSSYFPYKDEKCADFIRKKSLAVPTELGEAIIYDSAVIHYSNPNFTDDSRVVAGMLVVSKQAQLLFLTGEQDSFECDKYVVDGEFYLNYDFVHKPANGNMVGKEVYEKLGDPLQALNMCCG